MFFLLAISFDKARTMQREIKIQAQLFLLLVSFASLVLTVTFSGLIVAKLLVRIPPKTIDTFEDLRQAKNIYILRWIPCITALCIIN